MDVQRRAPGDFSILFIGTGSFFAAHPLKAVSQIYPLAGIVESARRGFDSQSPFQRLALWLEQRFAPFSLYRIAKQSGVPYYFLLKEDQASFLEFLESVKPDIGLIASMNRLLPGAALSVPGCGFINMHPSLLPDLRGPQVWPWLYYYNDRQGGVTIHQVDEGEDSGPILKQESFPVFPGMPPERLIDTAVRLGTRLLLQALEDIRLGQVQPLPQPTPGRIRRARRLKKEENLFDYAAWDLEHAYHFLQGVRPWYSPFKLKQRTFGVLDWKPTGFSPSAAAANHPGEIRLDWRGFYFSHSQGKIRLKLTVNGYYFVLFLLLVFACLNLLFGI